MLKLTTTEAREVLAELVSRAAFANERVILTRHGKELAVLVSISDLEQLESLGERGIGRKKPLTADERKRAVSRGRRALKGMQKGAKARGIDKLTDVDADAEISAARKARRRR